MTVTKALPLALLLVACASSELPPSKVAAAQSEIKAAEVVGAADYPTSALHLKLARDQLQEARSLSEKGDDEKAQLTLERARIDAELALTLARRSRAQQEAQATLQRIDEMNQR